MKTFYLFATVAVLCMLAPASSIAQQAFTLEAGQLGVRSKAMLSSNLLQIRSDDGTSTTYVREQRFDSADQRWVGFYSQQANQVIRWPVTNTGNMQIGRPIGNTVQYRTSQMRIQPSANASPIQGGVLQNSPIQPGQPATRFGGVGDQRVANKPVLPSPAGTVVSANSQFGTAGGLIADLVVSKLFNAVASSLQQADPQLLRIASYDTRGIPWVLSRRGNSLRTISSGSAIGADWWVAPVGNGYVRVQAYDRGRVMALSATQTGRLNLQPNSQDPRQLWRVNVAPVPDRFLLSSVGMAGMCLAQQGGQVALQPISYTPTQLWAPYTAPLVPNFQPFQRSVSTEVVANAQLAPAKLTLENSHRYALIVLVGDVRRGNEFDKVRVEPQSSEVITLDRDAGAVLVETVEVRSPTGLWDRQRYVTAIPPQAFYDLSVYEEFLQSIAIDATGKSPNPIEDVNYSPKSVGWLPLPAGPDLPSEGYLDVYERATAAKNPGAVRRMDPRDFEKKSKSNPLEDILEKYQSVPRRKF